MILNEEQLLNVFGPINIDFSEQIWMTTFSFFFSYFIFFVFAFVLFYL